MSTPDDIINFWIGYCKELEWQTAVQGITPRRSGNGWVYEMPTLAERPAESLAIVDMGGLPISDPHYHPDNNWEFYVVLAGEAMVYVGGRPQKVQKGGHVVVPPNIAHFTVPGEGYVLAAISSPPFSPEVYLPLTASNEAVQYDKVQFDRLAQQHQ